MAWGGVVFALLLAGSVSCQRSETTGTSTSTSTTAAPSSSVNRQLEPYGTAYHPMRHHQRPKDTSKLADRLSRSQPFSDFDAFHQFPMQPFAPTFSAFPFPVPHAQPYPYPHHLQHDASRGYYPLGIHPGTFPLYGTNPDKLYFHGKIDDDDGTSSSTAIPLEDRYGYRPTTERPARPGSAGAGARPPEKARNPFELQYGWTEIDFTWPSPQARRRAIDSGEFQSHNIITLDVDVFEHNGQRKVFVTMPRGDGVPVALATVSTEGRRKSPRLAPYPDWSWHGNITCDGISSVYRVQVDECGRLWVLDRGDDRLCTPQLLLFDLRTDSLVSRYRFPRETFRNGSNFITVAVDIRNGRCGEAFAYIADVTVPAIIVFDAAHSRSWRVEHPSFRPIDRYATYSISGREFYLTDGVFGLALGPLRKGERMLYYHPLASVYESWVPTSVLRHRENFVKGQNLASHQFHTSRAARASQSAAEVMDDRGTLFSGLLSETAITCWNSDLEFGGWNLPIVAIDEEALQFPSGMKYHNGKVWTMTSRYQNFATDTMDWNDVNYRILAARREDLVRGTSCDPRAATASNIIG